MKILSALKGAKMSEHPRSANSIILSSENRVDYQEKVHSLLKSKKLKFVKKVVSSLSSFPSTVVTLNGKTINIAYKPLQSGGSGAGAALTKLSESAQCLYAALAFKLRRNLTKKDISKKNFNLVSNLVFVDEKWENMMNLPDEWVDSCIAGANLLRNKFKGSYTFHRGSSEVGLVEGHFESLRAKEGLSLNRNKWSPADIYLISKNLKIPSITNQNTILGLNAAMKRELLEKRLIGVSLKKIEGSGRLQEMNLDKKQISITYEGYTLSSDSMDGYLNLNVDGKNIKIQFRSFGGESLTGWQGEIKGASANQGKISLGPLNMILENNGVQSVSTDAAAKARRNDKNVARTISEEMVSLGSWEKSSKNEKLVQGESDKWRYSKMQVIELIEILESQTKKKRNNIASDIYLYASSQSEYSAPYMKLG